MKQIYAALLISSAPLLARAQNITNVTFNPSTIHECQYVSLTLFGNYPSPNYVPSFYTFDPVTFTLSWYADGTGTAPVTNFTEPVPPLGPWDAGTYNFTARLVLNSVEVDTWTTTVTVLPSVQHDPGQEAFVSVCNTGPTISLLSLLGGTPDPGGQWVDPFGANHSNNFVPGTDPAGIWIYQFMAPLPCYTDTLTELFLDYFPNNDPGISTTTSICASSAPVNLFTVLLGTPMAGGTWTGPGGAFSGVYDPAVNVSGVYTYSVPGLSGCPNPTATVTVTETSTSNAGTGGPGEICVNDTSALLNQFLTGSPLQNGTWYDPIGFNFGPWNATFNATEDLVGTYKYIQAAAGCVADTALVVVSLVSTPDCFVGVNEWAAGIQRFEVMPNPSEGEVTIALELIDRTASCHLEILNASGQRVMVEDLALKGSRSLRRSLALGAWPKGVYVVRLLTDTGSAVRRVVLR